VTERVRTPYEGTGHRPWVPGSPVPAPLRLHEATVPPAWVDYNGHMSESCYLLAFGDNADALFRFLGIDEEYRAAGHSLYTVETRLHHRAEAHEGDRLAMTVRLLDADDRRLHLYQEMTQAGTGVLVATAEQLLVHVDTEAGRSAAMPPELAARVQEVLDAHRAMPVPETVGRPLGIRRREGGPTWTSG
jgi:carnitine 3-dehydrogenase